MPRCQAFKIADFPTASKRIYCGGRGAGQIPPLTVAENLSWETFSQVNLNLPFLSGVQPRVGDRRIYSFADATAHTVGYVGIETKRDIEVHGNAPSDMVGRSGIERYFEAALRGGRACAMWRLTRMGAPCANWLSTRSARRGYRADAGH